MAVQRLTAAYRSRPRPSSTPGAKASAVCPYYLDGELNPSDVVPSSGDPLELGFYLCITNAPPAHQWRERSNERSPELKRGTLMPSAVFKVHRGDQRGSPASVSEN